MVAPLDPEKKRSSVLVGLLASLGLHAVVASCVALLMHLNGGQGGIGRFRDRIAGDFTPIEIPAIPRTSRPGLGKSSNPFAPRVAQGAPAFDLSRAGLAIPAPLDSATAEFDAPQEKASAATIGLRNAGDPRFFSFVSRLTQKVEINWHREIAYRLHPFALERFKSSRYEAVIELEINPDGDIVRTELLHSSGDSVLDNAALQAVIKVLRAPNPPTAMFAGVEKHNTIVYSFHYDFTN